MANKSLTIWKRLRAAKALIERRHPWASCMMDVHVSNYTWASNYGFLFLEHTGSNPLYLLFQDNRWRWPSSVIDKFGDPKPGNPASEPASKRAGEPADGGWSNAWEAYEALMAKWATVDLGRGDHRVPAELNCVNGLPIQTVVETLLAARANKNVPGGEAKLRRIEDWARAWRIHPRAEHLT